MKMNNSLLLRDRDFFFEPIKQRFDKVFDDFFSSNGLSTVKNLGQASYPKMDIFYDKNEFIIEACVPGLKTENLKVEVIPRRDGNSTINILKISGQMDYTYQRPNGTAYAIRELKRSQFERSIQLPEGIIDEPVATLSDGILKLVWNTLPEVETNEARIIPIRQLEDKN